MEIWKKKTKIEIVEYIKDDTGLPVEVKVQNQGQPKDRWFIDIETFYETYEEAQDYAILTSEQRDLIRLLLENILINYFKFVKRNMHSIEEAVSEFMKVQKIAGEKYRSFSSKKIYLMEIISRSDKFVKNV